MKIILSGGGKGKQTKEIDFLFFDLIKKNKVVFIPHSREKEEFESSLNWIKENLFLPFEHNNFEMWTDLENKSIKDLEGVKGIVIGGGNTFKLLKELKDSLFFETLREFIKKEGVVYGISAGAIILTKSIITAKPLDENKVRLVDLDGMNLLNETNIFCHYTSDFDKKIFNMVNEENLNIIALPEGTGIYLGGDNKKIIGSSSAFLFSKEKNKKELKIGEEI